MGNNQNVNLEYKINNIAFNIVSEKILDENEINKLLGVLANDGVCAMCVYALDKIKIKDGKDRMGLFINQLFNFLELFNILNEELKIEDEINDLKKLNEEIKKLLEEEERLSDNKKIKLKNKTKERNKIILRMFKKLSKDINDILFFKEILEKTLIYARYHAKALGD